MKVTFEQNYSGYITIPRSIFYLVKEGKFDLSKLAYFIYLMSQADFDSNHKHFSTIMRSDKELAKEIGISETTIYRPRLELIELGLLKRENGNTKITNFHMFEIEHVKRLVKLTNANTHELFLIPQKDCVSFNDLLANMQGTQVQNIPQSFSNSSKEHSSISEDDAKWINENVYI